MNNKLPLVSIIIPTHKRDVSYLSRAVESVLNQTYSNIEIIVIDDSPVDYNKRFEIRKYMENVVSENKNVIYIQNERNMGVSLSRNHAIDVCRGEYVTFLDDDDEYRLDKVEKQVRFMQKEDCDMSFSNMIMYDKDGHVVDFRKYTDIKSFDNDKLLRHHLTKRLTGTPSFMYKTEKLRTIGGFDNTSHGEEFYLMLKSIENGLKVRYMNECGVIVYRYPEGGLSYGTNKIIGEKKLFTRIKKYYDKLSVQERMYARFRHWIVMAVAYKRNKMLGSMLCSAVMAFCVSPIDFIKEVMAFILKVARLNGKVIE